MQAALWKEVCAVEPAPARSGRRPMPPGATDLIAQLATTLQRGPCTHCRGTALCHRDSLGLGP